jgi:hypothetical protein
MIFYNISLNTEDEKTNVDDFSVLCLEMGYRLESEKSFPESPIIFAPSFNSQKLFRFPYRYSQWKSSIIYPRLLTPCEHNIFMNLLIIFDRICRQYNIIYFIYYGTLLGSFIHHDIIPWDDDVDVMIPYHQREIFLNAFKALNQTLIEIYLVPGKRKKDNYYKIFYKNSPYAGNYSWRFPYIDIFFYAQNETYLWNLIGKKIKIDMKYIFPLILRPLGQLWVPAPRKPQEIFQFDPFDECLSHFWDHRNEIRIKQHRIKCNELKDIYPFVERNNKTNSIEILKINNTIIHTIIY